MKFLNSERSLLYYVEKNGVKVSVARKDQILFVVPVVYSLQGVERGSGDCLNEFKGTQERIRKPPCLQGGGMF